MLEYFGHHGRFGAEKLDNSSSYILNDFTLTLIVSLIPLLFGFVDFFAERRGKTGQP